MTQLALDGLRYILSLRVLHPSPARLNLIILRRGMLMQSHCGKKLISGFLPVTAEE